MKYFDLIGAPLMKRTWLSKRKKTPRCLNQVFAIFDIFGAKKCHHLVRRFSIKFFLLIITVKSHF
jgi:hypothetical protein